MFALSLVFWANKNENGGAVWLRTAVPRRAVLFEWNIPYIDDIRRINQVTNAILIRRL